MQVLRKAFTQQLNEVVSSIVNSVGADAALIEFDIKGSIAHAKMLNAKGLITEAQGANILQGLEQILKEFENGSFKLNAAFEDVHMNVEKRLEALIGEDALRLHTARSRNDQVALDLRLYTLAQVARQVELLALLIETLHECARANLDVVMPGYTHLQRAQPVLFAHALDAFSEMFKRDIARFTDLAKRAAVSPLGAGAQAGTGLNIDPQLSADYLKLPAVFANSIDAVSDRDFVCEFVFAASLTAVHLSQMAETFVLWASSEFNFITLSDAVTTASSLMPQKKNPDPVEIVRGKTGAFLGELVNTLTTLKGLPLGYNRDLQESKPPVITTSCELARCIQVMIVVLENLTVNAEVTLAAASQPDMITTDLVEYLVNKGVPFRQAHEQVSALVAYSREQKKAFSGLSLEEYRQFSPSFDLDAFKLFDPQVSVSRKRSAGSTGSALVKMKVKEDEKTS
jgi:argininosuccinate lyase